MVEGKLYLNKKADVISFANSKWKAELGLYVEILAKDAQGNEIGGTPQCYKFVKNNGTITSIERIKSLEERIEALETSILSSLQKEK